jgi:hypothetical protein
VIEGWVLTATGDKSELQPITARAATADRPARPARRADNMWHWDGTTTSNDFRQRVYARDYSDFRERPVARPADGPERDQAAPIGRRDVGNDPPAAAGDEYPLVADPVACPFDEDCWTEAEIIPDRLSGQPLNALGPSTLDTFEVIRAVGEVGALGYFDCVNARDHAFASFGPCHWTLGTRKWHAPGPARPRREVSSARRRPSRVRPHTTRRDPVRTRLRRSNTGWCHVVAAGRTGTARHVAEAPVRRTASGSRDGRGAKPAGHLPPDPGLSPAGSAGPTAMPW